MCDPVLGDDGKLYLPAEMVPLYRSNVVPLATVITPNQFEAEQLTEQPIKTEQDALKACQSLLQRGPQTVVQFLLCRIVSFAWQEGAEETAACKGIQCLRQACM